MFYADTIRDAQNESLETDVGTSPILRAYNGTPPADETTALSGNTLIAEGTLPSDWMATSSGGVKAKAGTWTLTGQSGAGAGTAATFFRIYRSNGTTSAIQGTFGAAIALNTSTSTAANSNVLTFASTTGVAVGQFISGTGIPVGSRVLALTGTTVTMSLASTAGVGSAAAITFGYEMNADNNNIATGQTVTVSAFTITRGN